MADSDGCAPLLSRQCSTKQGVELVPNPLRVGLQPAVLCQQIVRVVAHLGAGVRVLLVEVEACGLNDQLQSTLTFKSLIVIGAGPCSAAWPGS